MASVTFSFVLDTERDKRLIRWLEGLPKRGRSRAIREVLGAHLGQNGVTLRDIYEAIQDLGRCSIAVASAPGNEPGADVPPDVLKNLSKLGL